MMLDRSAGSVGDEARKRHPGSERLDLARALFRTFHGRCFWHSPADLEITEELIPFVMKGLRTYGGRRGFVLAAELLLTAPEVPTLDRSQADGARGIPPRLMDRGPEQYQYQ